MKLDVLVMAVHPDDAELACSGTIIKLISEGKKVGILDFTAGELGTRGTAEIRLKESEESAKILGLNVRENLGIRDGFFINDEEHQLKIIRVLRKYQPEIVLANAIEDRHPDHGRAAQLAYEACFYSGLRRIETFDENNNLQAAWRPKNVFHYIQDRYIDPDFAIDVTDFWEQKLESIKAFKSQFFDPNSPEPASYISSSDFLDFIESRSREMGHKIGATHGEGFTTTRKIQVKSVFDIL
ncbi:MAG: bacillithiol biosynthesis deacetylase BshB1 [Cytophagaceae bacterium]|nr:bacillithiol biosynthesis deacetylase BshB1 [Cytophagaceae bacterium]MBK9933956.1 bacillithiol biosynthesis deacetylase BshB1 [Cytophagaceae bacterium]MBL0327345.1 bacillithiol biosynthesis deacetylase BshB1 [Cytophagaceae bacterium]